MKKIFMILLLCCFMLSIDLHYGTTQQNTSYFFKLVADRSGYIEEDDLFHKYLKPPTICEIIGDELIIYKFNKVKDENGEYWGPLYDANNNQIRIDFKKDNVIQEIYNLFEANTSSLHIIPDDIMNIKSMLFIFETPKKELKYGYRPYIVYGTGSIFYTDPNRINGTLNLKKENSKYAFYFVDNNYIYRRYELNGNKIAKYEQKVINPDIIEKEQISFFEDYLEAESPFYNNYSQIGKGFLEFNPNKNHFISCGKNGMLSEFTSPRVIDNSLFVELSWFMCQMCGTVDYSKENIALYFFNYKYTVPQKVIIPYNNTTALRDNKEIILSKKLLRIKNYTFISIRDICQILEKQIRWRTINNSCLIERF